MKKNIRKILAVVLALASLFMLSLSVFAADISAEKSKEIALKNAGYSANEVLYIRADYDIDDGIKVWNVDFHVKDGKGRIIDYDYEISASDGRIFEKDWDYEDDYYPEPDDKIENAIEAFFSKIIQWLVSLFS